MNTLAETMISGDWIVTIVVAVIGAVGAAIAKQRGKAEGRNERVTLDSPVPEVPTRKVLTPPSWDAHRALCDRVTKIEETTSELRRDLAGQYRELMQAGAAREASITDKLDGIARGIHARIDDLMKPKTSR